MRWRLEKYLKRQGRYKLITVLRASSYADALAQAQDRHYKTLHTGRWRLYREGKEVAA